MADASWVREYQDGETVPGTPYRVIRLLGAGGMGSVYEVEHIELGRRYVLKSLLCTLASRQDLIARMRNEWRALGKLRHPNIVDIINAGTTSGDVPYYVMEYLSGETVRDRLQRVGKLPIDEAVRIARGTLFGVAAAHAIGVVHRDIKPANVFLTRDGAVKVLDFGVAQVKRAEGDQKITAQGLAIGTPRYMSPEQASGDTADARSDLYATGLLIFEMIAGEGPFDDLGDTSQQMLAHLHRPARALSRLMDVPAELEAIVKRALAKRPQDRPRSAEFMAAELAPFAASSPSSSTSEMSPTTPSGVVLTTPTHPGLTSDAEWERPTLEMSSLRRRNSSSSLSQENKPLHHTLISRSALAAAVVAGLTIGLAVLTFGAANKRPAEALATPVANLQPHSVVGANATTTPTGSATPSGNVVAGRPAGASTTGASTPTAASTTKTAPDSKTDVRRAPKGRPRAPVDPNTVRLPPSGL
jgi:eukaryotic-like serine/threonine-protein kinase